MSRFFFSLLALFLVIFFLPFAAAIPATPGAQIAPAEKAYLESALTFLSKNFEATKDIGKYIDQLDDSSPETQKDVSKAILRAHLLNGMGLLEYSRVPLPPKFRDLDKKIRRSSAIRTKAFREILRFWDDSQPAHVTKGFRILQAAIILDNESLNILNTQMELLPR